jgi:hypothetical protein
MTPNHVVNTARAVLTVGSVTAAILMLGPWAGLEETLGMSDKVAHAVAFGSLVAISFLAFPRMRRNDLAAAAVLLGASVEIAQLFTPDRTASFDDLFADAVGVTLVYAISHIEQLRAMARKQGSASFSEIKAQNRRRRRRRAAAIQDAAMAGDTGHPRQDGGFASRASQHFPRRA